VFTSNCVNAPGLYYEGYHGMKGWTQYGNLDLTMSDHSQGMHVTLTRLMTAC
jgi:hypothetical protein